MNDVGERLVCSLPPSGQGTCAPVPGATTADNFAGWSADSRQIVVFRRYPIPARVDRVDIVTGRREPWTEIRPLESAVSGVRNVLALPDGRMVCSCGRDRSQLYVISGLK